MSANKILARLKAAPVGSPLDWKQVRDEISDEYENAGTDERVTLLKIYTAVMDAAERGIRPADLDQFRTARRQDYSRLLVSECLVDGNVSPQALAVVTSREVEAGRMKPDDELRRLSRYIEGAPDPGKPAAVGGWRRALGFGRKRD